MLWRDGIRVNGAGQLPAWKSGLSMQKCSIHLASAAVPRQWRVGIDLERFDDGLPGRRRCYSCPLLFFSVMSVLLHVVGP